MDCYYTLCHNTYDYSLLFYKDYIKRENASSWDTRLEKKQILQTYSAQLQKSWNSTKQLFGINKNFWAPWWAPSVHLLLYHHFYPGKTIVGKLTGWNSAATRRNLGGINLGLWRSCSAGDTSLREGEIITNVITNDPLIGRASISINIFTSTISSQNPSSSLVSNLVSKPQIGTCGLLVVLITPCSWC